MATRQYIGARYVPKFYQNSVDGSTQWEANVVYEPLVYVTLQNGHMYISKKQVPATIGTPASNMEYWLDAGTYNGMIDDLQNQINALVTEVNGIDTTKADKAAIGVIETIGNAPSRAYGIGEVFIGNDGYEYVITTAVNPPAVLNNGTSGNCVRTSVNAEVNKINTDTIPTLSEEVESIANKVGAPKILFMGDSYNRVWEGQGWDIAVANLLGGNTNRHYYLSSGGYSFTRTGYQFIDLLRNNIDNISDKDKFTDIILCAGANENSTYPALKQAISDFNAYCKTQFPNAKLHVGFIGWSGILASKNTMVAMCNYTILACQEVGVRYLHNVQYVLRNYGYLFDNREQNPIDYIHPTVNGNLALGAAIAQAFLTGEATIHYEESVSITPSGSANGEFASGGTVGVYLHNNALTVALSTYYTITGLNVTRGTTVDLGYFESDLLRRGVGVGIANCVFANGSPLSDACFLTLTNNGTDNKMHIEINWRGQDRTNAGGGLIPVSQITFDSSRN